MNNNDSAEDIKQFAREKGAKFPILMNNTPTNVVELYKVEGYPTNVVIDREGRIVGRVKGYSAAKLQAALRKAGVL